MRYMRTRHSYRISTLSSIISDYITTIPNNDDFFFSAPGGDLQTLIDGDLVPLEGDVVHFVRQLVEGLAYLHERNIAHLDIKVSAAHKRSIQSCRVSHRCIRIPESVHLPTTELSETFFSAKRNMQQA